MFRKNTHLHLLQVPNPLSGHEIHHHHHGHHDLFATHYLQPSPPILEPSTLFNGFNQDIGTYLNQVPSTLTNTFAKKPTTKKGRHSKIETPQGPRDRRVRLSIHTARKFFDLQEMLGVDKPSKTLNWLLTKSKAAIKELVVHKSGNQSICDTSSPSEYEECDYSSDFSKGKKCRGKYVALDLAKESRTKARARARERTKVKMCVKQLNEDRNKGLVQFRNYHQSEVLGNCEPVLHIPLNYEAATHHHDQIQESSFMKRQFGFSGFGTNAPSRNATHNWDGNFASQSNQLCAILDQHKFIN